MAFLAQTDHFRKVCEGGGEHWAAVVISEGIPGGQGSRRSEQKVEVEGMGFQAEAEAYTPYSLLPRVRPPSQIICIIIRKATGTRSR